MKGRQIQKLNSYLVLMNTCRENIAIISLIPAMMRCVQQFDKLLTEIIESAQKQELPITGFAKKKMQSRITLSAYASNLAKIIYSYAASINNFEIRANFDYTYSDLMRKHSLTTYLRCLYLYNFLSENLDCFRDFGIGKKQLDKLKELNSDFNKNITEPRNNINKRINLTRNLKEKINQSDKLLNDQMDRLLVSFSQFPEFQKSYKAARKQIKYGRPKEVLKNKIKKYRSAPALPRTRKSSKPLLQFKSLKMPEMLSLQFEQSDQNQNRSDL